MIEKFFDKDGMSPSTSISQDGEIEVDGSYKKAPYCYKMDNGKCSRCGLPWDLCMCDPDDDDDEM